VNTTGPALALSNGTLAAGFKGVSSSGGAVNVSLANVGGTADLGIGALSGSTVAALQVQGGSGSLAYAGSIAATAGRSVAVSGRTGGSVTLSGNISDTGTGILVQDNSGGTVAFTGASKTVSTGAGAGVTLAGNSGAAVQFAGGGLAVSTTTGAGFSATGGGTVQVTGANNTLASGGGVALHVADTDIGASGITFRSISANGGSSGIVLSNTGSANGLNVTGSGTAGSGGTIQNVTGDGVSLAATASPALSFVTVQNSGGSGIRATAVSGMSLNGVLVEGSGDSTGGTEAGLFLSNLSGTSSVAGSTIRNSYEDNVRWSATGGTATLNVSGSTVGPNNTTTGNSGINVVGSGSASATLNVVSSTFPGNRAYGIGTSFTGSASQTVNVSGSAFADNNIAIGLTTAANADATFDIANNPSILRSKTNAIQVLAGAASTSGSQIRGRIRGNVIGDNTVDSGARDGIGIGIEVNDDADAVVEVTGNTVRHTDQDGIFIQARDPNTADGDPATATADFTVTGNTVGTPDDNSAFPIFTVYGVRVESRHATTVCMDIAGNTSSGANGTAGFRVRQRETSAFRLERLTGAANDPANVSAFITGQNAAGSTASATLATTFTVVADGACRTM
jgi:hypothetical protein